MNGHAHELRRHARKLGHPAGDTPAVMHQAAAYIEELERRLREAEARVAELEADAARYRYIRTHRIGVKWCELYAGGPELDAAIDAMIPKHRKAPDVHWADNTPILEGTAIYAAPPVTAPVRLTDKDFARLYDEAGFDPNEMREAAEHMFNAIQSAVLRANGFDIKGK